MNNVPLPTERPMRPIMAPTPTPRPEDLDPIEAQEQAESAQGKGDPDYLKNEKEDDTSVLEYLSSLILPDGLLDAMQEDEYDERSAYYDFISAPNREGIKLEPYLDPIGRPTIGSGTTRYEDGTPVNLFDKAIDSKRAEELAWRYVEENVDPFIEEHLGDVELNPNQRLALRSLLMNTGPQEWYKSSKLFKNLKAGDYEGAAEEFLDIDKVTDPETGDKRSLPGLTQRRKDESELFLTPYEEKSFMARWFGG